MKNSHQIAAAALAKCAAYDPWFPQPNRATVDAWAEQIERYELGADDVLKGVAKMYADNGSGFRPLPKDLTDAARAIRRERCERETDTEREARENARDAQLDARTLRAVASRVGTQSLGRSVADA